MPDPNAVTKPSKGRVLALAFFAFLAALVFITVLLPKLDDLATHEANSYIKLVFERTKLVVEHVSVALLIAAILSLTYEYLLDAHREKKMKHVLQTTLGEFYKQVELNSMQDAIIGDPHEVMALLYQVVIQIEKIPTLYNPAREHHKECNFTTNLDYLNALARIHRKEITEELRDWVRNPTSPVNIKFLASDFIGEYRIADLQDTLWNAATAKLNEWANITDPAEKSWVLNYIWAYSRCEKEKYKALGDLLLQPGSPTQKKDNFIDRWILFVPLQMQDPEFLPILRDYVNSAKSSDRALENFVHVEKALKALQTNNIKDAEKVLKALEQKRRDSEKGKGASA